MQNQAKSLALRSTTSGIKVKNAEIQNKAITESIFSMHFDNLAAIQESVLSKLMNKFRVISH